MDVPVPAREHAHMERWRVDDMMELADAAYLAGLGSFVVRRTVQRLERGEIEPLEATRVISLSFLSAPLRPRIRRYRQRSAARLGNLFGSAGSARLFPIGVTHAT